TCEAFGDAYIKSRSSVSFTSEIKDFIAPIPINISNCATVIIRKQTNPDGATQLFDYTKSFPTSPSTPNAFQLADNGVKTFTGVTLGSGYTVVEGGPPPGWSFNHLDCSASTGVSPTVNGATATFNVDDASDIVDCTYFNDSIGNVVIRKITSDGHGAFDFTS